MMIDFVNGINAAPAAGADPIAQPASKGGLASLGQADFLKLLTVQLQQQDPSSPVDQTEMLAQMAQFSMLSGITEINERLKSMGGTMPGE